MGCSEEESWSVKVVGNTSLPVVLDDAQAMDKSMTAFPLVMAGMENSGKAIVRWVEEHLVPDVMMAEIALADATPCC